LTIEFFGAHSFEFCRICCRGAPSFDYNDAASVQPLMRKIGKMIVNG
jgi:hypothetical protein